MTDAGGPASPPGGGAGERSDGNAGEESASPPGIDDAGDDVADESRSLTTFAVLAGARRRLAANPRALVALLVAGSVVAAGDWFQLRGPVPTEGYEGVQAGRVAFPFGVAVTVLSRATVSPAALLHLKPEWLAATVGVELAAFVGVVAASGYALARLLDVRLALPAVLRYGLLVTAVQFGVPRVTVEGGAVLLGLPVLVAFVVAVVRLVPLPGRLVLGESFRTALGRSWDATRGHGWALLGVAFLVGLANHLLASVPVVGPVGSALAGAVHAGVVATVVRRTNPRT